VFRLIDPIRDRQTKHFFASRQSGESLPRLIEDHRQRPRSAQMCPVPLIQLEYLPDFGPHPGWICRIEAYAFEPPQPRRTLPSSSGA
jgi:hypothetical protein